MSEDEFPVAHDGLEVADGEGRQGKPLHPGEHTIVHRNGEPLTEGEKLQVWFEAYAEGHGTETVTGEVIVIQPKTEGHEGDVGDVFAIPAHQEPTEASRVYRIAGDLSTITAGVVIPRPRYDTDAGELTITREVKRQGNEEQKLLEVRSVRTRGEGCWWGLRDTEL